VSTTSARKKRKGGTDLLPRLERITPAVSERVLAHPASTSAIEIEILVGSMDDLETLLGDSSNVLWGQPDPCVCSAREAVGMR